MQSNSNVIVTFLVSICASYVIVGASTVPPLTIHFGIIVLINYLDRLDKVENYSFKTQK